LDGSPRQMVEGVVILQEIEPPPPPVNAAFATDYIDIDLTDGEVFERAVPYAAFEQLRSHAPVAWHPEAPIGGDHTHGAISQGFWAVTNYAGVAEVSRTPEVFSAWLGTTAITTPDRPNLGMLRQMMLNMDPPEHSRLRRILQPLFVPRAVKGLTDSVIANTREIVDGISGRSDPVDLVTAVSAELPLRILADLLGVPRADRHMMFEWSNAIVGLADPEYGGDQAQIETTVAEMLQYGSELAAKRKIEPKDDLVSLICHAQTDQGEGLSDVELAMFWLLLVIAGNETTRNSLSGGVLALLDQGKWGELSTHPPRLPTAVDELLRFVSPVHHFRRTATIDTELQGQHIRAGDKVVVWYTSANRDETEFPDPDRLDLRRSPNKHLAFGGGPHFCLGSHLARLQLATMLGELTQQLPDLELAGREVRMRSNFINGIRHLNVVPNPAQLDRGNQRGVQ
jgi:cytochrome P450